MNIHPVWRDAPGNVLVLTHSGQILAYFWSVVYFPVKKYSSSSPPRYFHNVISFQHLFFFSHNQTNFSHSYISVSLFHFHLSCCRNHFLFRCHYLKWASPYRWLFHLISNIKNIIQPVPWIACLGLLSLLHLNYNLKYSLTVWAFRGYHLHRWLQ